MSDEDLLRDSLAQIGDQARPVDFLDRSLSRSKRIGRNRAIVTSAAVVAVLAVTGGVAWQVGRPRVNQPTPAVAASATPSTSAGPSPFVSASPSLTSSPPVAGSVGSVAGLPGWLYYADGDRLLRLTGTGTTTVLSAGGYSANVSPDGQRIAFVDTGNNVVVSDRDGKHRRTVLTGSVGAGFEPVWSADSGTLLAVKNLGSGKVSFGYVTVASGTFTPLAHQLTDAIHPLWSADGRHLGYATGTCQLGVADADCGNARVVPVFGDLHNPANPQRRRSCDPYSLSADGRLMAVNQRTGDEPDGDIGRDIFANAVVDTRTGANVSLPVTGAISAILFLPTGEILVRSGSQLTLLNPDRTIKIQVKEPAVVRNTRLLASTGK